MNITADGNTGHVNVSWDPSTDDLTPQSLIRYDVYINGVLSAVVVGNTTAATEVDSNPGVNTIAVIAVDAADNESEPGTITVIF